MHAVAELHGGAAVFVELDGVGALVGPGAVKRGASCQSRPSTRISRVLAVPLGVAAVM
jgi:hypothetical protein